MRTEEKILSQVDHPFLATLYATIQTDTHLHFLLELCEGGELYALLNAQVSIQHCTALLSSTFVCTVEPGNTVSFQALMFSFKLMLLQPHKRLAEPAVKFYGAEIVLALQYLHLTGVLYRDLKPENILLHHTGHIMLTDFDLSSRQNPAEPRLEVAEHIEDGNAKTIARVSRAFLPYVLHALWPPAFVPLETCKARADRSLACPSQAIMVVANPDGRANSFVGTEEYLAPEVITGAGHTSCIDWWSFGILLYELLFGTTPFRGARRDATFDNVLKKPLVFPESPAISAECRDLITKLLDKDPAKRLGAEFGAAEVRHHPWFRCAFFPRPLLAERLLLLLLIPFAII